MQKTKVVIILDKSGSMSSTANQAIMNYNEQVQQFKENCKDQEIKVSLVTFNGDVYEHFWLKDASELEEAELGSFNPNGSTALWDAMGYSINKLKENDDGESSYLVLVISDGESNVVKKYNQEDIKKLISGCNESKRWTFSYMGCSIDYVEKISSATGIPLGNCAAWANATAGQASFGYASMNRNTERYFKSRSMGVAQTESLCSEDNCVADYSAGNDPSSVVSNYTPDFFSGNLSVTPAGGGGITPDFYKRKAVMNCGANTPYLETSENTVKSGVFRNSSKVEL